MQTLLKSKSLFILLIISTSLFACNTTDQLVTRHQLENKVLTEIVSKEVSPDKLPGWCPYQCHDIRCRAYQYGYCGPDSTLLPPLDTIAVITNPNNPYDYAGADHNTALNAIYLNVNPSIPNIDSVIETQAKNYAVTNWGTNADSIQVAYASVKQQWNVPPATFPLLDSLGNDLYNMGQISNQENNYIQQISSTASQWLNVDTLTQEEYTNFAFNLISIESQIKNDTSLVSNEKSTLLIACSIARYSAEYWGNYINEHSSSSPSNSVQPQLWKLLAKVLTYTVVDLEGAVACSEYVPPVTPGMASVCVIVGVIGSADYGMDN
ncbi:MAG: hypothetical protein ACRDE2_02915 [Chitinophagaceae bacterium]